nr:hypothetical protein [Tanacetum cinerariifolium]
MNQKEIQQAAGEEAWVPKTDRVKISSTNMSIDPTMTQKEETYQVIIDIIKNTSFYKAFLVTADVPEIYMQQFWHTVTKIKESIFYEFKLENKKSSIINKCLSRKTSSNDRLRQSRIVITWGMYYKKNVDFAELIWEDFSYQIDKRQLKKGRREIMPYNRFTKIIINNFLSLHKSIPKGLPSGLNTIKDDGVLSRMKLGTTKENQRKRFKREAARNVAFELGKSINKTDVGITDETRHVHDTQARLVTEKAASGEEYEESDAELAHRITGIQVMTVEEQFAADTKKATKASKQASREATKTIQQSGGSSEGAGVTPEGDEDDDKSIDIKETDDERTDSNNGDQAMTDMEKNVAKKTEEVQGDEEQAEEAQDDDDQDQKDQADDDIIGTLVTMSEKEKPKVPRSSSSYSLSSNDGNKFLNLSSDESLVGTIKEITNVEINYLLDVQIQQEISSVLSAPLLDVLVSVIPSLIAKTTTPPITTPIPTLPIIKVKELKHVDHSTTVLASVRSQVPSVVDEYLGLTLGNMLQKEQAAKEKVPKFSSTPYDQQADEEHKQKDILFKMMMSSKSYERHTTHKALYDALLESIFVDENDMDRLTVDPASQRKRRHEDKDEDHSAGSDQGKEKRKQGVKSESSKKSSTSKESSKGNTPPKTSKTGKFVHAEETVKEATHEVAMDVKQPTQENAENNADQPQCKDAPKTSKISNKDCDEPEQTWFKDLMHVEKPPLTFDELMATPIDFSNFAMNRLKIDNLTQEVLLGPVYNLLKGDRCPFDLSKPLSLKGHPGHLTVAAKYFFNNDLKYLKSGSEEIKYTTSITKTKAAKYDLKFIEDMIPNQRSLIKINKFSPHDVYSTLRILSVASVQVEKLHGYGYLKEIVVRRADQKQYKLIEVALRMFTKRIIILKRVEDVQFGVESYQKKISLTKPQKEFPTISTKELYNQSFDPPGVVYEDSSNRKRLMRADELYKFSHGTLTLV